MTQCTHLAQQYLSLQESLGKIQGAYRSTLTSEMIADTALTGTLVEQLKKTDAWQKEFQDAVRGSLREWFVHHEQQVTFDERNRVIYHDTLRLGEKKYFPSIIARVEGNLISQECGRFVGLEEVTGNFTSDIAIKARRLHTVGGMLRTGAAAGNTKLPILESIGGGCIVSSQTFSAPKLRSVDYLHTFSSIKKLNLPALEQADSISSWTAVRVSIPRLSQTYYLNFPLAQEIHADSLETVKECIYVPNLSEQFKFADAFPHLQRIHKDDHGVSMYVKTKEQKEEIKHLVNSGQIQQMGGTVQIGPRV